MRRQVGSRSVFGADPSKSEQATMADDLIEQFSLRLAQGEGPIPHVYKEMIARGVAPIKPKYISVSITTTNNNKKFSMYLLYLFILFVS